MTRTLLISIICALATLCLLYEQARGARYSGSAWVDTDCKRYSGSAWVDCTPHRYSGSAWVDVSDGGGTCTTPQTGDIISEGFLGTGAEYVWDDLPSSEYGVVVDLDHTLTGTPPTGSCTEGVRIDTGGITSDAGDFRIYKSAFPSYTGDIDITMHVRFNTLDMASSDQFRLAMLSTSAYQELSAVSVYSNGTTVEIKADGAVDSAWSTVTTDTWYTILLHIDTTAADSYLSVNGTQYGFTMSTGTVGKLYFGLLGEDTTSDIDVEIGGIWVNTP